MPEASVEDVGCAPGKAGEDLLEGVLQVMQRALCFVLWAVGSQQCGPGNRNPHHTSGGT